DRAGRYAARAQPVPARDDRYRRRIGPDLDLRRYRGRTVAAPDRRWAGQRRHRPVPGEHGWAGRPAGPAPVYRRGRPAVEAAVTAGLHVATAAGQATLTAGERLTFGRARECTICLDPDDLAISRIAGALECEYGTWWVANRSATRPLSIVDDLGFRSVLAPGRRAAVEARTQVIVDGSRSQHTIRIS